ncbi:MAG: hypothetical protein ABH824_04265 [Nanoarchaeota archaeon]
MDVQTNIDLGGVRYIKALGEKHPSYEDLKEELFKYTFTLAKGLREPYFDKEKDWPNVSKLAEYVTGISRARNSSTPFYAKLRDIYSLRKKEREDKLAQNLLGGLRLKEAWHLSTKLCEYITGVNGVSSQRNYKSIISTSTPFYQTL